MAAASSPFLILSLLSSIFLILPNSVSQSLCKDHNNKLHDLNLKISQLESILDGTIQRVNTKIRYLEENAKLIDEMTHKIDFLQTSLTNFKDESAEAEERVSRLEEEVRLLWATLRKNNFDIHKLESNVRDAEVRLEAVVSEVEKIADIVTEQWIQIRQLDQALLLSEMRTSKTLKQAGLSRCSFLKFIKGLHKNHLIGAIEPYLFGKGSTLSLYVSRALHQLKESMLAAKRYHHEASALIMFPIWSAWMLLLFHFSQ